MHRFSVICSNVQHFKEMFFVVIQFGAILAVIKTFWSNMIPIERKGGFSLRSDVILLWKKVIVACFPSAVIGLAFDDFIDSNLSSPVIISSMLIIYGVLFIIIERANREKAPDVTDISGISYKTALIIGMFQALSLIPGTSRSGATIIGALLAGVSRTAATEFTFYLAVPTMLGASLLKMIKFGFDFEVYEVFALLLGMVVAYAVSAASIRFLVGYVKKHDFSAFGVYRIALGIILMIYYAVKAFV